MAASAEEARLVVDLARRHDRERLLACLFLPAELRPRPAALVLLDAELARIPGLVREPMAGLVRYRWWQEQIVRIATGDRAGHPALAVLAEDLRGGRIPRAALLALVEAHERLFEEGGFADDGALETHAERTAGLVQQLSSELLLEGAAELADLARDLGTAYGLVGLLSVAPRLARSGIEVLPTADADARSSRIAVTLEGARRRLAAADAARWRRLDPATRLIARLAARRLRWFERRGVPEEMPVSGDPLLPARLLVWRAWRRGPPRPRRGVSRFPGSS